MRFVPRAARFSTHRGSSGRRAPVYGSSLRIEPYGTEPIPECERHGRPARQFTLWFAANMVLAALVSGFFAASFGLSVWEGISAVVAGTFLGSLIVGVSAGIGTRLGVPQQVQGRGPMGYYGNFLPVLLLVTLSSIGWAAVDTVFAVIAVRTLVPLPFWIAAIVIFIIQTSLAVWGHNAVHAINVVMTLVLAVLFGVVTWVALRHADFALGANPHASMYIGQLGGWVTFAGFAFAYVLTWAPLSSDFSRYLPKDTAQMRVAAYTFLGNFVALAWLEILGVLVATSAGTAGAIAALAHLTGAWAPLAMVAVVLSTFPVSAIVLYGASLSLLTLRVPIHRNAAVILSSAAALGVALWMRTDPYGGFYDFLDLLAYLLTPFSLIMLLDYAMRMRLRSERNELQELFDRHRTVEWGFVAWVVGCGVSSLFWHSPLWTGPLAAPLARWGDLSYLAGAVSGVAAYLALFRLPALSSLLGRRRGMARGGAAAPSVVAAHGVDRG